MKQFFVVLLLICLVPPLAKAAPQPRTLMCNFDGENETKVYKVVTLPGVGTTFRLPEGWKITDVAEIARAAAGQDEDRSEFVKLVLGAALASAR